MVSETPRWHATVPPLRKRGGGIGGLLAGLFAVLLGIAMLAGPPLLGAWANGSFDHHTLIGP